jgi:hypothetical protein
VKSVRIKEDLPEQWKESAIVKVCKKSDKTYFSDHCGISLLSTSYKIVSSIVPSRLSP